MRLSFEMPQQLSQQFVNDMAKMAPHLSHTQLEELIEKKQLFCCKFNQRYVAYALFSQVNSHWKISALLVREETRERGIGRYMFEQLKHAATQANMLSLHLPKSEYASGHAFYHALGIKPGHVALAPLKAPVL